MFQSETTIMRETEDREQAAHGACRSIVRVAALLRKEADKVFTAYGLSAPQYGILRQLDECGRMPQSELGKRLWVSLGNVTGLVDKLVAAGYVRRVGLRGDRRVTLAELTDKGREALKVLHPAHREWLLRMTAGLDVTELHNSL